MNSSQNVANFYHHFLVVLVTFYSIKHFTRCLYKVVFAEFLC